MAWTLSWAHRGTAILLLAALLPLLAFSGVLIWIAVRTHYTSLEAASLARVRLSMEAADRVFDGQFASLRILAESNTLNDPNPNTATFQQLAERYVRVLDGWDYVTLTDPTGRVLIDTQKPFPPAASVEPDGDAFLAVFQHGRETIGSSVVEPTTGKRRIGISAPVVRAGTVRYMLTASLNLEQMSKFAPVALPGGRAYVANAEGILILAPGLDDVIGTRLRGGGLRGRRLAAEGSYISATPSGEETVVFFANSTRTGWSAHIAYPRSVFDAAPNRLRLLMLLGGGVALVLTGVFIWLLKRENDHRLQLMAELEHERRLESIGRVASSVAHDFNNLLSAIKSSLSLLPRGKRDTDRGDQVIAIAGLAVDRGAALVQQLLSLSRKQELRPERIDLPAELAQFQQLVRHLVGDEIAVAVDVEPGVPAILADRGQLTAALTNLCTNARDAMPDGGTITIRARPALDDRLGGDLVVIGVTDTGHGMPPEVARRAFEPFFTTKGASGNGLGLASAARFAEQSGGTLRLVTEEGAGTTVELWLKADVAGAG